MKRGPVVSLRSFSLRRLSHQRNLNALPIYTPKSKLMGAYSVAFADLPNTLGQLQF